LTIKEILHMPIKEGARMALIVEDSPTQSMNIKALLENSGLHCALATNGQTGLYLAQSLLPDVIVLDFEMPQLNGFQVATKLKEDESTAGIPVIMMTRFSEKDFGEQGKEMGFVKFIPKDVFADAVLLETLRQMKIIK
jgi:diguanylate cyclase